MKKNARLRADDERKRSAIDAAPMKTPDQQIDHGEVEAPIRTARAAVTKPVISAPISSTPRKTDRGGLRLPAIVPVHPGDFIRAFLEAGGCTAATLAQELDLSPAFVSYLINGGRDLTADTAIRLEHVTGISAQTWMERQVAYDLHTRRKAVGGQRYGTGKLVATQETVRTLLASVGSRAAKRGEAS